MCWGLLGGGGFIVLVRGLFWGVCACCSEIVAAAVEMGVITSMVSPIAGGAVGRG